MSYDKIFQKEYSFTVRTVPTNHVSSAMLEFELRLLEQSSRTDAVLVVSADLKEAEVEQISSIPKPVLFLGDFCYGDYPGLKINQLTCQNDRLTEVCIKYFHDRGHKRIAHFSENLQYYFNAEFHESLLQSAAKAGITIETIEPPGFLASLPYQERYSHLRDACLKEQARIKSCSGGITSSTDNDNFLKCLEEIGTPIESFPLLVTGKPHATCPGLSWDFKPFYHKAYEILNDLTSGKNLSQRVIVDLPVSVSSNQILTMLPA